MKKELRENLIDEGIWMRGVFMALFFVAYNIAELLIWVTALFQFVSVLVTGRLNETMLRFGNNLSYFSLETFKYMTFNSNLRPFPFSPWPDKEPSDQLWGKENESEAEFEEIKANDNDDFGDLKLK